MLRRHIDRPPHCLHLKPSNTPLYFVIDLKKKTKQCSAVTSLDSAYLILCASNPQVSLCLSLSVWLQMHWSCHVQPSINWPVHQIGAIVGFFFFLKAGIAVPSSSFNDRLCIFQNLISAPGGYFSFWMQLTCCCFFS